MGERIRFRDRKVTIPIGDAGMITIFIVTRSVDGGHAKAAVFVSAEAMEDGAGDVVKQLLAEDVWRQLEAVVKMAKGPAQP